MDNGHSRFFTLPYLALPPVIPAGPSLHRQPPPYLASSSSSLPRQPPHLAISVVADFLSPQAALCRLSLQINRLPVFLTGRLTSPTLLQQISSPVAAPHGSLGYYSQDFLFDFFIFF
ncbi:hypothetical protein ACOSQ3_019820 [Xanthoceras sorbifolium]